MHLKHCSSSHNTSRDLEVQKTCIKIGYHRCYKYKEKPSEGDTSLCKESLLPKSRSMLNSFNSLLIKFNVSTQETSCQNFFSSLLYVREFFLHNSLVQEFFSYANALAGYFFQNHSTPPPQKLNGWPLKKPFFLRKRGGGVGGGGGVRDYPPPEILQNFLFIFVTSRRPSVHLVFLG